MQRLHGQSVDRNRRSNWSDQASESGPVCSSALLAEALSRLPFSCQARAYMIEIQPLRDIPIFKCYQLHYVDMASPVSVLMTQAQVKAMVTNCK